jgi:hypothetical protein
VTIRATHEAASAGAELRARYTIAPFDAGGSLILMGTAGLEPATSRV